MATLVSGWTVVRKTKDRGLHVFIHKEYGEETTEWEEASVYYSRSEAEDLLESCLPPEDYKVVPFTVTLAVTLGA